MDKKYTEEEIRLMDEIAKIVALDRLNEDNDEERIHGDIQLMDEIANKSYDLAVKMIESRRRHLGQ